MTQISPMSQKIECPKCHTEISVQDALAADIEAKYQKQYELNLQVQLKAEKTSIEQKLKSDLAEKSRVELEDLKTQLQEKSKQVQESQKAELELRKKARELEDKEKSLELDLQRKLDAERIRIQEETAKTIVNEQRLKAAEKDKQLEDMRKQIEDLKRKAEQGSQQSQGEILEIEIEAALKSMFQFDLIEPVGKGMTGADIVHKVMTSSGEHAGTIIWETKRTKIWSDQWIAKLKQDQRAISAEIAVIISQALPKDVSNLASIENIWVTDFGTFRGTALALRSGLMQVHQAKNANAGKSEKMEFLYGYLTGTQFKQRVEAIVESFRCLKSDLDKEKRALQKMWATRDQQIERALVATVGLYGDVQGVVGAGLPRIEQLELDAPDSLGEPT